MHNISCRFCKNPLQVTFADLGSSPISNEFIIPENLLKMEPFYLLRAYVCDECFLVQLPEIETTKSLFDENYAYFSSYSQSWLEHSKEYVEMATNRFNLNRDSHVVELASNDGYLLQYFLEKKIKVLGIEPCKNVADVAESKGVSSLVEFFGAKLAKQLASDNKNADLIIGNNVLAHVPDINDFVAGMKILLKDDGVITIEFPHLMRLIDFNQFDTIYHEHYSYLSLIAVENILKFHSLRIFDVEELSTHGGSLRVYISHEDNISNKLSNRVQILHETENKAGLYDLKTYKSFQKKIFKVKNDLLKFLINAKENNKKVVGYGAPAKGNTLLNYCGVGPELLSYTVDRSPHKQNKYLPGTRIPVYEPGKIIESKPDYVLILPWNLKNEIMNQMTEIRNWGGRFVIPIPTVEICD